MKERIKALIDKIMDIIKKPEMLILPGQLSFFFLLTLIPIIAVIMALLSTFNIPTELLNTELINRLPEEIRTILLMIENVNITNSNIIVFIISALLLGSNGTNAIIVTCSRIYNIKDKGYFKRQIKSVLLLVLLILAILTTLIIPVALEIIVNLINDMLPINMYAFIKLIYNIFKYPVILFVVFIFIKLLYYFGIDQKIKFGEVNYGAIFSSIGIVLTTIVYGFYTSNLSNYSTIYGNLANILVLMWWIYLISSIFTFGIYLNYEHYKTNNK